MTMRTHARFARAPLPARGFTLIEAMMAMAVLLVSALALASMQVMGTRTNRFGDRMVQASALATDLGESMQRWDYSDTRLAMLSTKTDSNDSVIAGTWDMGRDATSAFTAEYSDLASDPNATNQDALGATWRGLDNDVDRDGTPDFTRYWNVYGLNLTGGAGEDGKLIQIIVRWKEPGVGYHQVTHSTYKRNPGKVF
jgi:prepilin-type N-terminal cleavage/methylation domain-containing protein